MSLLFALLLWAAAAAGRIPIPGTPVGITLQTFVLMLAALSLDWREASGAVVLYLLAGAAGLPVFSGGMSTLALVGPSAGFLFGFLPGVIVASLLKGKARGTGARGTGARGYWLTAARYFGASLVGCVVIVYAFGVSIQAMLTHVPLSAVALASLGFAGGDLLKAVVASAAVSGLSSRIARDAK
ncbi:biotin transporter BioY [Bifidobacterium thermophilum]|nr:biotin transporter BioY [Bifidobacterium thermophilum]MDW8486276.1 biotin transporter BioY [Bifidobacterium thermophilum]